MNNPTPSTSEANAVTRYELDQGRGYTPYASMVTDAAGDWVKYDDYEKDHATIARLESELEQRRKGPIGYGINDLRSTLAQIPDGEKHIERLNSIVGQAIDQRDAARKSYDDAESLMYAAEKRAIRYLAERDTLSARCLELEKALGEARDALNHDERCKIHYHKPCDCGRTEMEARISDLLNPKEGARE